MAGPLRGLLPALTATTTRSPGSLSGLMMRDVRPLRARLPLRRTGSARLDDRSALLAIHLAFLLSPPLQYTDVFNYINYGRMGALHHLNPYTVIPALEPHADASFALSNWHYLLSPYGPAVHAVHLRARAAGGGRLVLGDQAGTRSRKPRHARAGVALRADCSGARPGRLSPSSGCNPIVLVWGLGADHNDSLMLFFVVLAVYLPLRTPAAPRAAGAALVVAVFIKASAAVLLPVFLAAGPPPRPSSAAALASRRSLGTGLA